MLIETLPAAIGRHISDQSASGVQVDDPSQGLLQQDLSTSDAESKEGAALVLPPVPVPSKALSATSEPGTQSHSNTLVEDEPALAAASSNSDEHLPLQDNFAAPPPAALQLLSLQPAAALEAGKLEGSPAADALPANSAATDTQQSGLGERQRSITERIEKLEAVLV